MNEDGASSTSTDGSEALRIRKTEMLAKPAASPAWSEAPVSSNIRKAQVRAALFRKLEPVRIGRFILLESIGAGAMGEIYAAYDDQLDRKVALKLVRGGSGLTAKADDRLLREAQTLAQVSHPNVVQIYEAGTYSGRLFIAMELIRGKTLTSWLKDAAQVPRAVRQREVLRRFIAAGRGLEAAHAAGLAHRDFKPDNVLVGDDGRVRVVDFGLARALVDDPDGGRSAWSGGDLDDDSDAAARISELSRKALSLSATVPAASTSDPTPGTPKLKAAVRLTETGTVMGTPSYMAPETLRGAIADRRSDQFSFCVALYHALYETFPFSGQSLRELRDSMESGEVAFAPGVPVPAFVRKALYRGLSVEPSQRFASMGELLAALEPKARRRRSWIAAAVSLVVVALGAGMYLRSQAVDPCAAAGVAIDAPWSVDRQVAIHAAFGRSGLPFAEPAWRGVKTRVDGYARSWHDAATSACQATHIARTQSAQQLDKRMLCLDRGRRQLAALVTELGTGAPGVVEHAIEAVEALPELDACSHTENLLFGLAPPPAPVAARVAAIRDQVARAFTLELLGRDEESLVVARDASVATKGLGYPPVHAEALAQTARALDARGTADAGAEAKRLYFEALDIAEAERHDQLAARIWNKLVMLAVRLDSATEQAHAWWRRNAAAVRRVGDDDYEQAKLHHMLGEIYYRESGYAKAADEERRAIAAIARVPAHQLELSRYYDALAKSLELLDDLDGAMRLHERALALATETLGAGHLNVVKLQINYGRGLEKRGQPGRARSVLEDALGSMSARDRDAHPSAAKIHSLLSDLDNHEGHLDRAAEHASASLAIYQRTQSPDHVRLAEAYMNLANVEQRRRNFTRALAIYEDALALRRRHLGNDHYQNGVNEGGIAETLVELERYKEAMTHLVEAERIFQRGSGRERGTQAWILTVRGEILAGKRQFEAALPVLEQALALFGDNTADSANHALAMWTLARALHELGRDTARVRSLAEGAHAIFATQGVVGAHARDAVARFLDRLRGPTR
jgi:serine/threonine protein kinase/tetratricopeptide (TPR) repeat protein